MTHVSANNMNVSAGRSTYTVWIVIFGVPFVIIFISLLVNGFTSSFLTLLFCLVVMLFFVVFWISRFNLKIDDECIYYSSLFSGTTCIRFTDITSVRHRVGIYKYTDRFLPPVRLEIRGRNGDVIIINLKVFNREDIDSIIKWLAIRKFDKV